ncbi:hypothetical protein TRV_06596 [Trichophyton verrucosum HKI 0517]|uniref:AN1-type domain-containing protein n=1 Tax=Trichophyton verrucosum (strain HKI 0517) TaxID=663202 RepID=D4DHE0_TRIVH|nr:uncharacterized protein TRV_06596 [Trichophyton verrucosum HKI 0517]EFE38722.1 hypothetical protein TRV_06596 [Trichophyton verrucosum HKI 0517]
MIPGVEVIRISWKLLIVDDKKATSTSCGLAGQFSLIFYLLRYSPRTYSLIIVLPSTYLPIGFAMSSSAPDQHSYTQMADRDLEDIGKHCEFEFCRQLDFLPFRCESCKGTFCLDHRTETTHKCPKAGEWARRRTGQGGSESTTLSPKPTVYNSTQCSHPSCKALIYRMANAGVHCQNCNREYCLSHRMREDHDCSNLTPLGASPAAVAFTSSADKARQAFSRLRSWGKAKAPTTTAPPSSKSKAKPSAASRMAQLNALKKNAKGDPNLDTPKRFYLHVEASADTTTAKYPTGGFYFDAGWSVGKILDDAARRLQVQNVNNRSAGEENRLRIFHVEGGKLLDFSNKIGSCSVAQGDTIVLLRGVGPPVPDLIEM